VRNERGEGRLAAVPGGEGVPVTEFCPFYFHAAWAGELRPWKMFLKVVDYLVNYDNLPVWFGGKR
jgi:hypothetical protein